MNLKVNYYFHLEFKEKVLKYEKNYIDIQNLLVEKRVFLILLFRSKSLKLKWKETNLSLIIVLFILK